MDTEETCQSLGDRILALRRELEESRGFLSTYMLAPSEDLRPAEEERIRDVSRLADEMMEILDELTEENESSKVEDSAEMEDILNDDVDLEFKTHTLGVADGEDNIDGDWNMDEEDLQEMSEATLPEAEAIVEKKKQKKEKKSCKSKKEKKSKKDKKDKKDKKSKKEKKRKEAEEQAAD